ncbi:MAG: NAD(P)-dependent glycerol-3-phosphate dehydrogenase [Proteobacteria bacterium]|nr:NAD(P)-dependent glycerol-3-phosphate dehydrogenase [Pseudomonadota bacterium]
MKLSVLGAGAWGTAIAAAAAPRNATLLWARDAAQAAAIGAARCNARYLPEVQLPPALAVSSDLDAALRHAAGGLLIIATPMAGLRGLLQRLPPAQPAMWLCKGFEAGSGLLGHEIARSLRPQGACGVLSGPSFALEVARGQPTALVAASDDEALAAATVDALHGDALRLYTSSDVAGVEVGGALKNVLAIATGMLDGMAAGAGAAGTPGLNARAALITRGLAEMTRLGLALGARAETFMGLSGLGDLVLTATGDLSRNRKVGLLLAQGLALPAALAQLGHVAEGVYTARVVADRARRLGVEMPITEAVVQVLEARLSPRDAMTRLMARQARAEAES